jgi:hypothetical protein
MSIRRSALWLVLATAAGLQAGCEGRDPVILKLEGTEVRRSEFTKYLASVEARGEAPLEEAARAGLLDSFLEDRALVIEASAHGLVAPGAPADEERRAVARLLASEVKPPAPTEAEIRAYYGQHENERGRPERVALRKILVATLNEALLTDYLLKTTTDRGLRMYIINHALETYRTTLYRQTLFAEFERDAHARAEGGESLTPELLCQIFKGLNGQYYGPEVTVDELIENEWARIPHFYSSYYVYQYATGISAAAALASQILAEGAPARDRYLSFLSSGSSDYSIALLRGAGVDLSTPQPVATPRRPDRPAGPRGHRGEHLPRRLARREPPAGVRWAGGRPGVGRGGTDDRRPGPPGPLAACLLPPPG